MCFKAALEGLGSRRFNFKTEVVPNIRHYVSKSSFTKVCADARLLEKIL